MATLTLESLGLVELASENGVLKNLDGPEVTIDRHLGSETIRFKSSDNRQNYLPRSDREAVLRLRQKYVGLNAYHIPQGFSTDPQTGTQEGLVHLYRVSPCEIQERSHSVDPVYPGEQIDHKHPYAA